MARHSLSARHPRQITVASLVGRLADEQLITQPIAVVTLADCRAAARIDAILAPLAVRR